MAPIALIFAQIRTLGPDFEIAAFRAQSGDFVLKSAALGVMA